MNTTKAGSYGKLIAFFLVAIILLCAFGFAVEGWQLNINSEQGNNASTSGATDDAPSTEDDLPAGTEPTEPEAPPAPIYTDTLTGLVISEEEAYLRHLCFVMSSSSPLYGISGSQMLIEIPTEGTDTRLLSLTRNAKGIGKIGSITPTRTYISDVARYFGALLVSYGTDDSEQYLTSGADVAHLDLEANTGYGYSEYSRYFYSNGDLIYAGLNNLGIGSMTNQKPTMPYTFAGEGETVYGDISAKNISIPFSDASVSDFSYSVSTGTYIFSKNGNSRVDSLTDSSLEFDNVFILFADSVTYEDESSSHMVMNTAGEGKGIYASGGTAQNITWHADRLGNLTFFNSLGEKLTVSTGESYIGYLKSSKMSSLKLS